MEVSLNLGVMCKIGVHLLSGWLVEIESSRPDPPHCAARLPERCWLQWSAGLPIKDTLHGERAHIPERISMAQGCLPKKRPPPARRPTQSRGVTEYPVAACSTLFTPGHMSAHTSIHLWIVVAGTPTSGSWLWASDAYPRIKTLA